MQRFINKSLAALGISQAVHAERHFTKKCAQFKHPEFQITVANKSIPQVDVENFLSGLEDMVAAGGRFKAGETMQIGWMLTKLQEGENGSLEVTEPDMKVVPINFVPSVDATLQHMRAQKDSVESVVSADALDFPSLQQSVVVNVNYKRTQNLSFYRVTPNGSASGWLLSDLNDPVGSQDPNNFIKISLYQLGIDRPDLIKFLAFPDGFHIAVDRQITVLKDDQVVPIEAGSFLDRLNHKIMAQ